MAAIHHLEFLVSKNGPTYYGDCHSNNTQVTFSKNDKAIDRIINYIVS